MNKKAAGEWYWIIIVIVIALAVSFFILALYTDFMPGIRQSFTNMLGLADSSFVPEAP
jgi:hypothetical protein